MNIRTNTLYLVPALVLLLCVSGTASMDPLPRGNESLIPPSRVALKTANGNYLCAEGGGGREVVANRTARADWETFTLSYEVVLNPDYKVALRAANGKYVCAEGGGGGAVVANRDVIGPWETFTLVNMGITEVALKAANGKFLCAEGGGGGAVVANRAAAGPWETFTLESVIVYQQSTGPAPRPTPSVNGRNVLFVKYGTPDGTKLGTFRFEGGRQWWEANAEDKITFNFQEVSRDDWSVYLHDRYRNVSIQLDLHTKRVMYSDDTSSQPRQIYTILRTSINGSGYEGGN